MRQLLFALLVFVRYDEPSTPAENVPRTGEEPTLVAITMADPATYWTRNGFVLLTPPIRLPSQDGDERIDVWIRIPDGAHIRVLPGEGGRTTIELPTGTIVDRADLSDGRDPGSVQDVRGTRVGQGGQEYFHVLRPAGAAGLAGFEWRRDDPTALQEVTKAMLARLASGLGPRGREADPNAASRRFERQNQCASCHPHDKPERRFGPRGDAMPNRATDASGFYTMASVMADSAPLETHRARDMNEGDPFVKVSCLDGSDATVVVRGVRRHFACDDGGVPYGSLDMRRALDHGDGRALAVCASRRYLARHMTAEARTPFARVLAECGDEAP
jgi:hypothetical protein